MPTLHMSVAKCIGSYCTTSGAMNSGVPNSTLVSESGVCTRARPKSIILIRFPDLVKHRIFSGWNDHITAKLWFCHDNNNLYVARRSWYEFIELITYFWYCTPTSIKCLLTYLIQQNSFIYGFEACPRSMSWIVSIDFVINKFFMKLFNTDIDKVVL